MLNSNFQTFLEKNSKRPQSATVYKEIFKKNGIKATVIANYLGKSYPYTLHVLNGNNTLTPEIKGKLDTLVAEIKKQGGHV